MPAIFKTAKTLSWLRLQTQKDGKNTRYAQTETQAYVCVYRVFLLLVRVCKSCAVLSQFTCRSSPQQALVDCASTLSTGNVSEYENAIPQLRTCSVLPDECAAQSRWPKQTTRLSSPFIERRREGPSRHPTHVRICKPFREWKLNFALHLPNIHIY